MGSSVQVGDRVTCYVPAIPYERDAIEIGPGVVTWIGDGNVEVMHDNGSGGMFAANMVVPADRLVVQLHWQNPMDIEQTEFVAQAEFHQNDMPHKFEAWSQDVIGRRRTECPRNWCPCIVTQQSKLFVLAAA